MRKLSERLGIVVPDDIAAPLPMHLKSTHARPAADPSFGTIGRSPDRRARERAYRESLTSEQREGISAERSKHARRLHDNPEYSARRAASIRDAMTPEVRAKISAAVRARHARDRAAKAHSNPAANSSAASASCPMIRK